MIGLLTTFKNICEKQKETNFQLTEGAFKTDSNLGWAADDTLVIGQIFSEATKGRSLTTAAVEAIFNDPCDRKLLL